jgi:hypothetical protein
LFTATLFLFLFLLLADISQIADSLAGQTAETLEQETSRDATVTQTTVPIDAFPDSKRHGYPLKLFKPRCPVLCAVEDYSVFFWLLQNSHFPAFGHGNIELVDIIESSTAGLITVA